MRAPGQQAICTVMLSVLVGLVPAVVRADSRPAERALAALPGVYRVATAEPLAPHVSLFTSAGYGVDSELISPGDTHHRAQGMLLASLGVRSWLALALRFDGRYDRHTGLVDGSEDGLVGEPRVMLRIRGALNPSWHAGAAVTVMVPGREAPSLALDATSVDALALLSFVPPPGRLRAGIHAGARVDHSAASAEGAYMFSPADRLGLGVSESHALLMGAGAAYRAHERVEVFGEWTWDLHVGERAPEVSSSPMRVAGGLRARILPTITAQLAVERRLSQAPALEPGAPLMPFEPRMTVTVGLFYGFGSEPPARRPAPRPVLMMATITGQAMSEGGTGMAGARVSVQAGHTTQEVITADDGKFEVTRVPAGRVRVMITADGHEPASQEVTVQPGQTRELPGVTLGRSLPPGQLRGSIRSFDGKPVNAKLRIEPPGRWLESNAEGWFEIDVPPGDYEITIRADGFQQQQREVRVEQGGVTILNVDLQQE